MNFIFNNFHVCVWSSARRENVNLMINHAFKEHQKRILLSWSREQCDLSGQFHKKCDTVKDMRNLWSRLRRNSDSFGTVFSASNTIVLDDSPKKIKFQPGNQILVKEYGRRDDTDIELKRLVGYLKLIVEEFEHDLDFETYDVREFLGKIKFSDFQPEE